jgi:hypothetical protein
MIAKEAFADHASMAVFRLVMQFVDFAPEQNLKNADFSSRLV